MEATHPYSETVVPRAAVTFPLRVPLPAHFDPERLETWPVVSGRLEYFDGALWYMPPCGEDQQEAKAGVVAVLMSWHREHPELVVGTNEAGMKLGDAVRRADAGIWRKTKRRTRAGGLRTAPPVLAVEVAGLEDTLTLLREKAEWYLSHGTQLVWLLAPDQRRVVVITPSGETTFGLEDTLPEHPALPGLTPRVRDLFEQLEE